MDKICKLGKEDAVGQFNENLSISRYSVSIRKTKPNIWFLSERNSLFTDNVTKPRNSRIFSFSKVIQFLSTLHMVLSLGSCNLERVP